MKQKIFDIHTDILYDVYMAFKKGDKNRFRDFHLLQLSQSIIRGGIWTMYSPNEFNLYEALKNALSCIDFSQLNNFKVILGLEGLKNLKSLEEFELIYQLGFRHAMLTWNEENDYATGIKGSLGRGLTAKGREVLDFMISKDMIIDVSHLNEKSFFDVLAYTNKNIIASHSNIKSICDHQRNLSDEQLKKLKEADGLLGLTLAGSFIAKEKEERTIENFIHHLEKAVEILGIDNVCFGFDFMDYFDDDVGSNIEEVPSALYVHKIIERMVQLGFKEEDIKKITYDNFVNRFKHHIINSEE